jgi:hypothetical protein
MRTRWALARRVVMDLLGLAGDAVVPVRLDWARDWPVSARHANRTADAISVLDWLLRSM